MTDLAHEYEGEQGVECWNCFGKGIYYDCFEEFACLDPEAGCDVCEGKGYFREAGE